MPAAHNAMFRDTSASEGKPDQLWATNLQRCSARKSQIKKKAWPHTASCTSGLTTFTRPNISSSLTFHSKGSRKDFASDRRNLIRAELQSERASRLSQRNSSTHFDMMQPARTTSATVARNRDIEVMKTTSILGSASTQLPGGVAQQTLVPSFLLRATFHKPPTRTA